jgi:hypothetical protein
MDLEKREFARGGERGNDFSGLGQRSMIPSCGITPSDSWLYVMLYKVIAST